MPSGETGCGVRHLTPNKSFRRAREGEEGEEGGRGECREYRAIR